jgi:uncharacterized protein (TIGR02246 family)
MRALLFALALVASIAPRALADPKAEVLQFVQKWAKAFNESDVEGIVALYAPDVLFMGTGSKTLVTQTADIRKYFENALLNNRPRGATLKDHAVMALSETAFIVTGLDAVTGVRDGKTYSNAGRVTFVIAKRGADWKIVHFHRSAMPQ